MKCKKGKISIAELQKETVGEKVEIFLKNSEYNAYSVPGIMIELFNINESDIKGVSFKDMKEGLSTLYSKIRRKLDSLVKQNKAVKKKYSRAYFYYWKKDD